ncbi:hypothetical protein AMJ44_09835 [candidate division WOR-1 bacterium DG_54_3]|uniref:GTA TIM-barrel-like domain-containing protein n=1 Tax=candidate division WOR-1 bacterium DG_54_3 TaxID=1703775 RepID=A0A0S7XT47_UNCSA|nr:MAG: hypothetical protein AMJ44_09835 [candidate division WOR-1 bacterium DG_54_3]
MAFPTWVSEQYCSPDSDESLENLVQNTCTEWVQFVPSWYQKDRFANEMSPEYEGMTARDECLRQAIQHAHSLDLKVMLKPHVDALNGDWRGTFEPTDSKTWFENYQKMITAYAELAEQEAVEVFSIGCEFVELTKSEFTSEWREVIKAVRQCYQQPLVYSANWWQEYPQIEFWADLDYIGIDAYFPLTNKTEPTLDELLTAWTPYLSEIESFHDSWKIPIILTEIGYRSIDGANLRPWDWQAPGVIDLEEQALCYQAVIKTLDGKPWFEGIYWWNWEPDPRLGGLDDKGFTPFGKPAEKVLERWYCEMTNKKKGERRR